MKHVTFEDDAGAYDQIDAQGFIKLNALRLRLGAMADGGAGRCRALRAHGNCLFKTRKSRTVIILVP